MANPKRRQQRAAARRRAKPAQQQQQPQAPAPAVPPILRYMAEQVEANKFSPMMLFAGTMQMVHMERACRQDETPEDTKKAYTRVIEGSVDGEVVKVFVQQCFENAHPEEARKKAAADKKGATPEETPAALPAAEGDTPEASPEALPVAEKQGDTPEETPEALPVDEDAYETPDE